MSRCWYFWGSHVHTYDLVLYWREAEKQKSVLALMICKISWNIVYQVVVWLGRAGPASQNGPDRLIRRQPSYHLQCHWMLLNEMMDRFHYCSWSRYQYCHKKHVSQLRCISHVRPFSISGSSLPFWELATFWASLVHVFKYGAGWLV